MTGSDCSSTAGVTTARKNISPLTLGGWALWGAIFIVIGMESHSVKATLAFMGSTAGFCFGLWLVATAAIFAIDYRSSPNRLLLLGSKAVTGLFILAACLIGLKICTTWIYKTWETIPSVLVTRDYGVRFPDGEIQRLRYAECDGANDIPYVFTREGGTYMQCRSWIWTKTYRADHDEVMK